MVFVGGFKVNKIKMCAYIYKLKKNVVVSSVDFENKIITWFDDQYTRSIPSEKLYEIENFDEIFLCHCEERTSCQRRNNEEKSIKEKIS
jgi:hypothetical protein